MFSIDRYSLNAVSQYDTCCIDILVYRDVPQIPTNLLSVCLLMHSVIADNKLLDVTYIRVISCTVFKQAYI